MVSVGTGQAPDQSIPYADVKDAGVMAWLMAGIMEVLLEAPNVAANQIAETLLPDGSFTRFQAPLSGPGFAASAALDDWSPSNIVELQKAAADLVEQTQSGHRCAHRAAHQRRSQRPRASRVPYPGKPNQFPSAHKKPPVKKTGGKLTGRRYKERITYPINDQGLETPETSSSIAKLPD